VSPENKSRRVCGEYQTAADALSQSEGDKLALERPSLPVTGFTLGQRKQAGLVCSTAKNNRSWTHLYHTVDALLPAHFAMQHRHDLRLSKQNDHPQRQCLGAMAKKEYGHFEQTTQE
jgi:hypothetical protein